MNTTKTILQWFGVGIFSILTIGSVVDGALSTMAFALLTALCIPNNTYNKTITDKITNKGFIALAVSLFFTGALATGPVSNTETPAIEVSVVSTQTTPSPDVVEVVKEDKLKPLTPKPVVKTITPVVPEPIVNTVTPPITETKIEAPAEPTVTLHKITSVVDGDTAKVSIDGKIESIRIIGIDTPEIGSRLECFGNEAKTRAQQLLSGKSVYVELDPSQGERDKYGRLLAYLVIDNTTDFGEQMIRQGYAHEYTYNLPYKKQSTYKSAETYARNNKLGLWTDGACGAYNKTQQEPEPAPVTTASNGECLIKGNISSKNEEKIYHVPGQQAYSRTKISTDKGEKWFCNEQDAVDAGWRKALQ